MTTAPAWEEAFLKALAATGVASESARAAGIGVRAAFKRRQRNPTFAAAWEAVIALHRSETARRSMGAMEQLAASRQSGGKLVSAGQSRWNKRSEEAFLTELAVTADIRRAAAACGFSSRTVHARRLADRHFARAWEAAIAVAKARVDAYLAESADRTFDPESVGGDVDTPKMTIAEAIKVAQLAQGRPARPARGAQAAWDRPEERDWDDDEGQQELGEIRSRIVERLDRLRQRDEEEKLAAGWTRHGDTMAPPGFEPAAGAAAAGEPAVIEARATEVGEGEPGESEPGGPRVRRL